MRKLATIRKIDKIEPIEGADKIELAHVGGWKVVVAKNVGHKQGDKIVYCEIDSFLPLEPEFEFLKKSSYKRTPNGKEGYRLKTIRLLGQISQGLIISLSDAINIIKRRNGDVYGEMLEEGKDISQLLGIVKYVPPIPAQLQGTTKRYFPSFISKTDEERVQNLTKEYQDWKNKGKSFYATEKLDGSSATFYLKDGEFGVCSRRLELKEDPKNTFWKVARGLLIEEKLRKLNRNLALQGELVGEGIQKNPYKISGHTVYVFNVFDIDKFEKLPIQESEKIIKDLNLHFVPIVMDKFELPENVDQMLKLAEGKSKLNPNIEREGVVVRSFDNSISFKAISNKFLI